LDLSNLEALQSVARALLPPHPTDSPTHDYVVLSDTVQNGGTYNKISNLVTISTRWHPEDRMHTNLHEIGHAWFDHFGSPFADNTGKRANGQTGKPRNGKSAAQILWYLWMSLADMRQEEAFTRLVAPGQVFPRQGFQKFAAALAAGTLLSDFPHLLPHQVLLNGLRAYAYGYLTDGMLNAAPIARLSPNFKRAVQSLRSHRHVGRSILQKAMPGSLGMSDIILASGEFDRILLKATGLQRDFLDLFEMPAPMQDAKSVGQDFDPEKTPRLGESFRPPARGSL
jgi:hypothetical protein